MKIKKDFILREIVGDYVLVPNGETIKEFNGLITMNKLGVFIWEQLEGAETEEDILKAILDKYEIDEETARADLDEFLGILKKADII